MLVHLSIRNYALISELELDLAEGLTIITGETGAGKSIMLGAIGLLIGERADAKTLRDPETKCIVEGTFNLDTSTFQSLFESLDLEFEPQTIIRREIAPGGKSRAFVNDSPTTLDALKQLGPQLLDVHSQHDSLQLGSATYQLGLLDQIAENQSVKSNYLECYNNWRSAEKAFEDLQLAAQKEQASLEFNKYQLEQLRGAALEPTELEEAEQELTMLDHAEELGSRLHTALQILDGEESNVIQLVKMAGQSLEKVASLLPKVESLKERLSAVLPELRDIAAELEAVNSQVEINPARQDELNGRIVQLKSLLKKYNVGTVQELIDLEASLAERVLLAENYDELLLEASSHLAQTKALLNAAALSLTQTRLAAAQKLELEIQQLLVRAALPFATLTAQISEGKVTASGYDQVKLLFTANKGIPARELAQVASGGEFSRLMLCIKYLLAQHTNLPTIIFDEIDTGISGEVALSVGQMVKEMAQGHQLIVITHLAQMAAYGNHHWFVYKDHDDDKTASRIRQLDAAQREVELARMMSGNANSEAAQTSARELLAYASH